MVKRFAIAALVAVVALAGPTGAEVLGQDAAACTAGEGPAVLATIQGLKDRSGDLKLELYPPNDQDFLKDDRDLIKEGKLFRRVRVSAPPAGPVQLCMRVPHPGHYALFFSHNRDGKNKFSIWSDGAGLVSNQRIGRAKPKFGQALIDVPAGVMQVTIHAQYLHGLSGFAPLSG